MSAVASNVVPHLRISQAIRDAAARGHTALVPYMTAGYPEKDAFIATLRAVAAVGDVVEVGVLLTHSSDFAGLNEEYAQWFPSEPPAR